MARTRRNLFNSRKKDENTNKLSPAEFEKAKQSIEELDSKTNFLVHGNTTDFDKETKEDFDEIKGTIRSVINMYKEITSDNLIEFITKNAMDEDNRINRINGSKLSSKDKEKKLKDMLQNPQNGLINEIYSSEKSRINKMSDYEKIVNFIPQLYQALNVLVDNIMSPDDFTKDVFSLMYNGEDVNEFDGKDAVIHNLKQLEQKYKIEDKTKRLIFDTLKYGDQFVSIVELDKEFDKLFGEDGNLLPMNEDMTLLDESSVILSEYEEKAFKDLFAEEGIEYKGNLKKDIAKMINDNIEFTKNPMSLYKEELMLEADFGNWNNVVDGFGNGATNRSKVDDSQHQKALRKNAQYQKRTLARKIAQSKSLFASDNPLIDELQNELTKDTEAELAKKKRNGKVTGSYVKILDPRKVVKIYMNGTTYGYYYLETEIDGLNVTNYSNSIAVSTAFQVKQGVDINTNNPANSGTKNLDPKSKLILDVFLRNISKKLNKKFIENNDQFKDMIYSLLKQEYIIKNKVKITYLAPTEVEHLKVNEAEDGYGRSVFDRILFSAKIYLATLTTTLMLKLSRSADHRTFYIETGLSNDIEGIIQDFVREIRAKEVKMADLNSIDTILNSIGQFQDYFIPQFDGQKSIDIDTTPGQQVDMDNDLLEYLKKAMISGMGIPASFLSYADEMEFARSVSMMNGMFLRMIVGYQKSLSEGFSNIYRTLYRNEYGQEEMNSDDENEAVVVDYDLIEARFPCPATLNMSNLNEQIGSAQTISDYIVNTLIGGTSQDERKREYMIREVSKDILPNIDWKKYEEMLETYYTDSVEETIKDAALQAAKQGNNPDDMMGQDPAMGPSDGMSSPF